MNTTGQDCGQRIARRRVYRWSEEVLFRRIALTSWNAIEGIEIFNLTRFAHRYGSFQDLLRAMAPRERVNLAVACPPTQQELRDKMMTGHVLSCISVLMMTRADRSFERGKYRAFLLCHGPTQPRHLGMEYALSQHYQLPGIVVTNTSGGSHPSDLNTLPQTAPQSETLDSPPAP